MKGRVYIFDDDLLFRSLLEMTLADRGYEVFAFASPAPCPFTCQPTDLQSIHGDIDGLGYSERLTNLVRRNYLKV